MISIDENKLRKVIEYCLILAIKRKDIETTHFHMDSLADVISGHIQGFCESDNSKTTYIAIELTQNYVSEKNEKGYEYKEKVLVWQSEYSDLYYVINTLDTIPKNICNIIGPCDIFMGDK